MPFQKGSSGNPKGRPAGKPNKVTSTARLAFMATFGELEGELLEWIRELALTDKGKAADLVLRMAEYHFPKLGRTEISGKDGGPVTLELGIYPPEPK